MERLDGNLIPDIAILDANGSALFYSYGADRTAATALIPSVTLPSAGSYQIQAGRQNGETGVTVGKYRLTVQINGTAADNPNNTTPIGNITYGTPQTGEINGAAWKQLYTLTTDAPDSILVTAKRTSGNLIPYVEVIDSAGSVVSAGYPSQAGTQAQVGVNLGNAGEYQIAVSRDRGQHGDTIGGYSVQVDLIGAGDGSASLATPAGTVVYDTPLTGEIDGAKRYQDWLLTTTATDTVTFLVERSGEGSTLQPEVILLGGSGQEIRRGYTSYTGDTAIIENYTFDTPGSYTVRVTRYYGQTGESSGGYTLTVKLIGSGEGSPELVTEAPVAITAGVPVKGEITPLRWKETWSFTAQEGQTYNLVARRTNGTLIPRLQVLNSSGQILLDNYADASAGVVQQLGYVFPSAGNYQIVVYRYDGQYGYTSGGYELTVSVGTGQ